MQIHPGILAMNPVSFLDARALFEQVPVAHRWAYQHISPHNTYAKNFGNLPHPTSLNPDYPLVVHGPSTSRAIPGYIQMLRTFYINCTVGHNGFTIDNVHNARPIFAAEMTQNGTTYPKTWTRKTSSGKR